MPSTKFANDPRESIDSSWDEWVDPCPGRRARPEGKAVKSNCMRELRWLAAVGHLVLGAGLAQAQSDEDLAKQLSNPIAALISVPFQYNYDEKFGAGRSGHRSLLNIQPVIPFTLNSEWNIISRTIVPVIGQSGVIPGSSQSGLGDVVQSLFFSPKEPSAGGLIWGVGPVFLLPTGTEPELSARKWGAGPTIVGLQQQGPWTFGLLANHIWGVGGVSSRPNVSSTFLQPFVSYTTKDAWTFTGNTESTYDWKNEQWSVPLNLVVSKLTKFGKQPVSIGGGVRYWADGPANGPHGVGFRFAVTLLYPK